MGALAGPPGLALFSKALICSAVCHASPRIPLVISHRERRRMASAWVPTPNLSPPGRGSAPSRPSEKRLQTRLRAPEDQRVDVVGSLVGVDGLQVLGVAHDVVFLLDAIAAVHVAGEPSDVERLAAVVALDERNHLGRGPTLVEQAPDP